MSRSKAESAHPVSVPTGSRDAGASPDRNALLVDALQVLSRTRDAGPACAIVAACAQQFFGAHECRVLRADPRSGSLFLIDESGAETPYLPEPAGPMAWVLDREAPRFEAAITATADGVWSEDAARMTVLPLLAGGALQGVLALTFTAAAPPALDRTALHALADALALGLERAALIEARDRAREHNAQLTRARKSDDESSSHLLTVLAQEIRTPLTAIKAYAEVLLDRGQDAKLPRERFLGVIGQECDRLGRLVEDLFEYVRLDSKKRPLRLARFALDQLIEDALVTVLPVARARQVTFDVQVDPGLVVEVDSDLLRGALVHLAWNAVAFSPVPGRVRIEARAEGEDCLCILHDQGDRGAFEDLAHLFDRFHSARESESLPGEAHALGLGIAKQIVVAHGGRAWAEPGEPNGTRLCISLPRLQLASQRARRIAARIARGGELRGLFKQTVEEAAAVAGAQSVSLMWVDAERGDLVIVASHGSDASTLIGRHAPIRSGVAGSVAAWGEPILVGNIDSDRRFEKLNHPQYASKSLMSVPLRVAGEVLGVLNLTNRVSGTTFGDRDLAAIRRFVDHVGRTLERAFNHGSERVLEGSQRLFAIHPAAESPEPERDRVALAEVLAREMGLDEADTDRIAHVAALMSGSDDAPALAGREGGPALEVHREMLRPLGYLDRVRQVMAGLSERWDGSGVPHGLAGEAIPLGSRILAVVHAFARLREGTPYRPAHDRSEALEAIRSDLGTCFDPAVVAAFERVASQWEAGA